MVSEIATEGTIHAFVGEIKKELEVNKEKPDAVIALKALGRFALTLFEWSVPDWTKEYEHLFRE